MRGVVVVLFVCLFLGFFCLFVCFVFLNVPATC